MDNCGKSLQGDNANKTFFSQSTYILPVHGKDNTWIFMADRWTPDNPINARYIWLPVEFDCGIPFLKWKDEWKLK